MCVYLYMCVGVSPTCTIPVSCGDKYRVSSSPGKIYTDIYLHQVQLKFVLFVPVRCLFSACLIVF